MKLFGARAPEKAPKTIENNYLEKVYASPFRDVTNLIKTMENQLFQKSTNAIRKPYKNQCQMKGIWSKIAKWHPKTLKSIRFLTIIDMAVRHVAKPYKTNGNQ